MEALITQELYDTYFSALIRGDRSTCAGIVTRLLNEHPTVEMLYTGLFQRSMYDVGEQWELGKISVATEHLATSVTESLMPMVYPIIFAREHLPYTAVIACVADEYHQMGGRMVADIFEMSQWHGHFLGANSPLESLVVLLEEQKPDVLALSVSISSNLPNLEHAIQVCREAQPALPILIGGQAFRWGGQDIPERYPNVRLPSSLKDLRDWIADFPSKK